MKLGDAYWSGPMHTWFGLTYSSYLILPRTLLQGMPEEWQAKLVALLDEMRETYDTSQIEDDYVLRARTRGGKFKRDPLADYRRPPPLPYREPKP